MKIKWFIAVLALAFSLVITGSVALMAEDQIASVEERRILAAIEEQQQRLRERERQLDAREVQLKTLEAEVDRKIAAMRNLRTELNQLLERRDAEENERIAELSLIYERMNPQQAAALISELDTQLAVSLLLGIKKKTAGQIMERLNAETALKLSKAFTDMSITDFP